MPNSGDFYLFICCYFLQIRERAGRWKTRRRDSQQANVEICHEPPKNVRVEPGDEESNRAVADSNEKCLSPHIERRAWRGFFEL
jgi:hypothetical protein